VIFFETAALAMPVPADHTCMGRWVGEGRNTGHDSVWTIDLTLTAAPSGGRCGTIKYTNPDCGGTLESCELVGDEIHTREHYTHRAPNCAAAGRVIIRCEQTQMQYSWIGWERVDSILHRAATTRDGEPPSNAPASDDAVAPPDSTSSDAPPTNAPPTIAPPVPTPANPPPAPSPVPPSARESWLSCAASSAGGPSAGGSVAVMLLALVWLRRRALSARPRTLFAAPTDRIVVSRTLHAGSMRHAAFGGRGA
jgi:uncharacterized protein (TIGR03382 family)